MEKKRLRPEKKVEILREHLGNNISISELSEKYKVHPNIISMWKKTLFEGAVEIFTQKHTTNESVNERKIKELEEILKKRDKIIAEIVTENIDLKKNFDGKI